MHSSGEKQTEAFKIWQVKLMLFCSYLIFCLLFIKKQTKSV